MSDPIVFDYNTFKAGAHVLARILGVDERAVTWDDSEYSVNGIAFAYFDDLDFKSPEEFEASLRTWIPYYQKDVEHDQAGGKCLHTPRCRSYENEP